MFLFSAGLVLLAQQQGDPTDGKYLAAVIAALASIIVALISAMIAVFTLVVSRWNQKALQKEQADLTSKNQKELAHLRNDLTLQSEARLEKVKAELAEKTQTRLESLKSELEAKHQREMEVFRAKVGQQGKELDARRDYNYEAHKRLYAECEPLLFQLAETSEHAYHRIFSLARTARQGNLPHWLAGDGYYLRSTMYKLMAPLVVFRLIQERLTFVDLTLDSYIASQYRLLKLLYLSHTDAYDFAELAPQLEYRPDADDWEEQRKKKPEKYWRQGLYLGTLDNTIDALVVSGDKSRCKTFGEFESEFRQTNSETHARFLSLVDILIGFHPRTRPVFWRMLWTQSLIYKKIFASGPADGDSSRLRLSAISPKLPEGSLDWRQSPQDASDEEVRITPNQIANEYLRTRLPEVFDQPADLRAI